MFQTQKLTDQSSGSEHQENPQCYGAYGQLWLQIPWRIIVQPTLGRGRCLSFLLPRYCKKDYSGAASLWCGGISEDVEGVGKD
jgi:hypothetical protein